MTVQTTIFPELSTSTFFVPTLAYDGLNVFFPGFAESSAGVPPGAIHRYTLLPPVAVSAAATPTFTVCITGAHDTCVAIGVDIGVEVGVGVSSAAKNFIKSKLKPKYHQAPTATKRTATTDPRIIFRLWGVMRESKLSFIIVHCGTQTQEHINIYNFTTSACTAMRL